MLKEIRLKQCSVWAAEQETIFDMFIKGAHTKQGGSVSAFLSTGILTGLAKTKKMLFTTVFSAILRNRFLTFVLLAAACLQVGLTAFGLQGWVCPYKLALGVPCPGCGLSTAGALLIQGEWMAAVNTHLFSPILVLGFGMMAIVSLLPNRYYFAVVQRIETFEKNSGCVPILLIAMMVYWFLRVFSII